MLEKVYHNETGLVNGRKRRRNKQDAYFLNLSEYFDVEDIFQEPIEG